MLLILLFASLLCSSLSSSLKKEDKSEPDRMQLTISFLKTLLKQLPDYHVMYLNKGGNTDDCVYDDKGYGDMIKNSVKDRLHSILLILQDPLESVDIKENRISLLQHMLNVDATFERALLKVKMKEDNKG